MILIRVSRVIVYVGYVEDVLSDRMILGCIHRIEYQELT
jgi:hypothetical protein